MNSDDPVRGAIVALLQRIPETWSQFELDSLTEPEERGLQLLTAAGMVERRFHLQIRMHGSGQAIHASLKATGEFGLVEAVESLAAGLWQDWKQAYEEWKQGEAADARPFQCQLRPPAEWRLTEHGMLARQDVIDGKETTVVDFVLQRGFFDGQRHQINDKTTWREPVRGSGSLLSLEKVSAEAAPTGLPIANWEEGAQIFAKVLEKMLESRQPVSLPQLEPAQSPETKLPPQKPDTEADEVPQPPPAPPPAYKHRSWPGSDQWENWGLGLATDGTWHLFHFHRNNYSWLMHRHVTVSIPAGMADDLARKFLRDGCISLADAHDVLRKHAKTPVDAEVLDDEVISRIKSPMSRLRSAIRAAVTGDGHRPKGRPISCPTRQNQNWRACIKIGQSVKRENGGQQFKPIN